MPKSRRDIDSADALKPIGDVFLVDVRNKHIELEDWHARISEIKLTNATPVDVKQLFENAKNIALYTYFAYRLHQAAEVIGYSALEKALKLKFEKENENSIVGRRPKTLSDYMDTALKMGWITDEGYKSSRPLASNRAQMRQIQEMIDQGLLEGRVSLPIPEPTDDQIDNEMRAMAIAKTSLHAGRDVRNFLAHGEGGLMPSSIATLAKIAEEINQLFPENA